MLYSTYISKMKNIPEGKKKYLITRFIPNKFDVDKYENLTHRPDLSPSQTLLLRYKQDDDWAYFEMKFKREMNDREDLKLALEDIIKESKEEDIYIICYEKEVEICHRRLIGEYVRKQGIKYEEMKNN